MNVFENAFWIWPENKRVNQYVCFRKEFTYSNVPKEENLFLSADSDFSVFINGHPVGAGQFSDWPEQKTWSSFDVSKFLCPGKNVISVLGYWRGEDFFTYQSGTPGIIAKMGDIVTDETWKCLEHPAFQSGPIPKITMQLGFTFTYDARNKTSWQEKDFACSSWENARKVQRVFPVSQRPVAPLNVSPPVASKIVKKGMLSASTTGITVAEIMASRKLLPDTEKESSFPVMIESEQDSFLLIDLGGEQTGWLNFDLDAPLGTVLDIAHGEHLDDGRVRMHIGNRNFADRYICREGKNTFEMPFRRLGCRFLELHISGAESAITINRFSVSPVELELPHPGAFTCDDKRLERLRDSAIKTMRLCMHEHYEDCPWREQALYAYDSRMQMLFGYPVWGNYEFAATSLRLLRDGKRQDGLLEMCAPAKKMPMTIPVFSFAWGNQLWENYMYSGDSSLLKESLDTLNRLVESQYQNLDPKTGLYHVPKSPELWHFYEWTVGMHSHGYTENFHSAFNLYYLELLKNTITINRHLKKQTNDLEHRITRLTEALRHFRNPETGAYAAILTPDGKLEGYYECIQAMMLYHGIVPENKTAGLINNILNEKYIQMMPGSLFYLAEALFKYGSKARMGAWALILKRLYPMLNNGGDTLWEMCDGSEAFNLAGSLCHGWSALPAWLCHSWLLGIRPLEPGFQKFTVSPFSGNLTQANGEVVTHSGRISVNWRLQNGKAFLELCHPAGLKPVFKPLPEMPFNPEQDVKITVK
jgi:alpha-L-rhamnosidase